MQEKLVIYLNGHDLTHPSWAVVGRDHAISESALQDDAEGLAVIAEGKEVIVLVPDEDVLLTSVALPKMSRTRLMQAIPFALEDQLIGDLDTLHFAVGDHEAGVVPVMVVAHEKMKTWLNLLLSWGVKPNQMFPSLFGLPSDEKTWYIALDKHMTARTGLYHGFHADIANAAVMLDIAVSTSNEKPERLVIANYAEIDFTPYFENVAIEQRVYTPKQAIIAMANQISKNTPAMHLLQTPYAPKRKPIQYGNKIWQIGAGIAAALLTLIVLYPTVSYLLLKHKESLLDKEVAAIYFRHFPNAKSVIAPKVRLDEKLQKLSTDLGKSKILLWLAQVGQSLQKAKGVTLKQVSYQNNQLTLEITAASSEDFSRFTDSLTAAGLNVKQQNAVLSGERVNASVQID